MNILVLNCGSSSLKYKILKMPEGTELIKGEAERVGIKTKEKSVISHFVRGKEKRVELSLKDHPAALNAGFELMAEDIGVERELMFEAVAHRYVHPGTFFESTVKITRNVQSKLKKTFPFAPIHNPVSYGLIEVCRKKYPGIAQCAVFDTSFHRDILPGFSRYAMPWRVSKKFAIKKVGFHGISHRYVAEEACGYIGRSFSQQKIISCHLGTGGSSVCAVRNGRSINNSMGFTPLEGLMMNTRCGDIDPGAIFYIMFKEKFSSEQAETILNKKSGVLGVFNTSSDLRDVIRSMSSDKKARMTYDMYVRRVRTYVCFYALILKKADILIFTDSLGQGSSVLRESVCQNMDFMGIKIDRDLNDNYRTGITDVTGTASQTRVLVIPTDEEMMIAREAYKELVKR